jgi:hypothetical protein
VWSFRRLRIASSSETYSDEAPNALHYVPESGRWTVRGNWLLLPEAVDGRREQSAISAISLLESVVSSDSRGVRHNRTVRLFDRAAQISWKLIPQSKWNLAQRCFRVSDLS